MPKDVVLVCSYSRRKKHEQATTCEPWNGRAAAIA